MKLWNPNIIGIVNIEDIHAFLEFVRTMQNIIKIKFVLNNILLSDFFTARAIESGNKKVNHEPA